MYIASYIENIEILRKLHVYVCTYLLILHILFIAYTVDMNNTIMQCIFVMVCIISIQQVSPLYVNVKPSSYSSRMNCTDPCLALNDLLANETYFMSNVQLHFLAGDHRLANQITVRNVRYFH